MKRSLPKTVIVITALLIASFLAKIAFTTSFSLTWTTKGEFETATPRTNLTVTGTNPEDDADVTLTNGNGSFGRMGTSDLLMTTQASTKSTPDQAYDPQNNRMLVVWCDYRNGNADIYGRLINGNDGSRYDGGFYGASDIPIHIGSNEQRAPQVSYDSTNHRFLVVWEEYINSPEDYNVYGRLINTDGSIYGAADIKMGEDISNQSSPAVAFDSTNNRFFVVWHDDFDPGKSVYDIYGTLINADGTFFLGDGYGFQVNYEGTSHKTYPAVVFDSANNRFLTVWKDGREGLYVVLYGRVVNADGTFYNASDKKMTTSSVPTQHDPRLAFDNYNNRYMLVWHDNDLTVMGHLIDTNGDKIGAFDTEIPGSAANRKSPDVAFDITNHRYMVAWYQDDGITPPDIYGRIVDTDCVPQGSPQLLQTAESSPSTRPCVSFNSTNGIFLTAWEDMRPGYKTIYGRLSGDLPYPISATLGGAGDGENGLQVDAGSGITARWKSIELTGNIPTDMTVKYQIRSSDTLGSGNFVNPQNPAQTNTWSLTVPAGTYTDISPYTMNISSTLTAAQTAEILTQLGGGSDTPTISSIKLNYEEVSAPVTMSQYKSDGITLIPAGGTTDDDSAKLRVNNVKLSDGCSDSTYVKAQVQYKQGLAGAWSETADGTQITTNDEGQYSEASISGFTDGNYYWRARLADDKGRHSNWVNYNLGDIAFIYGAPAPEAPTIGSPTALSQTSIRWNFTDNANNELGFSLHDGAETEKATSEVADLTYLDESSLIANTQYTRHAHAYNAAGDSDPSGDATAYTKAVAPNFVANKNTSSFYRSAGATFTSLAVFGAGGVQYYRYAWDKSTSHTFTGTEAQWSSGTLTKNATSPGNWYLHVQSYNGSNVATSALNRGPYRYDNYKPRTYASRRATIKRNTYGYLYWKVTDNYTGGKSYVWIKIKKGSRFVKTLSLGLQSINATKRYRYRASLSKGTYRFYIYARDRAGNNQYSTASNYLVIR